MLTIRMNESAAAALQPLGSTAALPAAEMHDELRDKVSRGVVESEGALVLAAHHGSDSPTAALARMGWPDLTHYECQVNSFHLEDYAPVEVALLEDGQPQISHADQVTLLRLGLTVADAVRNRVRAHARGPACVVGATVASNRRAFHVYGRRGKPMSSKSE